MAKKQSASNKPKGDLPTQETLAHGAYTEEPLGPGAGAPKRLRRRDGSELDRLLFAKLISPDDHTTLERFRRDLYRAGMVFSPKSAIVPSQSTGQGQFMADAAFIRAKGLADIIRALDPMERGERDRVLTALITDAPLPDAEAPAMTQAASLLQRIYSY